MKVAVHTDFEYHEQGGEVLGEHAFTLFFVALAEQVDGLVLLGRLDPAASRPRYQLGDRVTFVGLPHYETLIDLRHSLTAMATGLRRFWRVLDEVEVVWLLGPHPLQLGMVALAALRRRRVVLGVRQEFVSYVASRHPGRRAVKIAAVVLERTWRLLARFVPVIVVGPAIARDYGRARDRLQITASLVSEADVVDPRASARSYELGELQVLSVGRLEAEKNPLLLADVLQQLRAQGEDGRWRAVIVGEGPMAADLEARLERLGCRSAAHLDGYVPFGPDLIRRYRESHVLLHVSWTEGLPQVLIEAFAAGLPVVATDVGGIREAIGEAALLIPAGDPAAAAAAVQVLADDGDLRGRLVDCAHRYVQTRTLEAESARVARFLRPGQLRGSDR